MNGRELWDKSHGELHYKNIFSILDSELVLNKFRTEFFSITEHPAKMRILIPGCGSNINLQIVCSDIFGKQASITAVDWSSEAVKISERETKLRALDIGYLCESFQEMSVPFASCDLVVFSNAVVSESHEENCSSVMSLAKRLTKGGHMIGTFPSPFNMLDYALTNNDAKHWLEDGTVNISERTIHEKSQDIKQRFFSPLELNLLLQQADLEVLKFEIIFYDDMDFAAQISRLYNLPYNADYCFWGYFIHAVKK